MKKLFAFLYDFLMEPIEKRYITRWRKALLRHTKGKVLEIGAGTGVNFPLYSTCEEVIAIEPNPYMLQKAEAKVKEAMVPIEVLESKGEVLPFTNEQFDTVVVTLVMCSVDAPEKVISEIRRVLKPGGVVLFLEHVKMEQPFYSTLQNLLTPVWKRLCDGCHLNRNTEETIKQGGLTIISKQTQFSGLAVALIAKK